MNILLLGNAFPPVYMGGESTHMGNLATGLSKRGHRVLVVHPVPIDNDETHIQVFQAKSGVEVYRICVGEGNGYFATLNRTVEAVCRKALKDGFPVDLVHCHSNKFGPCVETLTNRYSMPVITTVHAVHLPMVHSVAESKGLSVSRDDEILYREDMTRTTALCERSDRIVAISRSMVNLIKKHYHADPDRIAVIHNGIDVDRLTYYSDPKGLENLKNALHFKKNDKVILFAGRIEPIKGVKPLAMACKQILSERDDVGVVFLGNGSADDWLRSYLSDSEKVHFMDWLPFESVIPYYHLADMVVVPSLIEPFGLVAVEALACSNCVIVSNADGLREIITSERDGIQIPLIIDEYGDRAISHNDIYAALKKAISEPQWRQSLARCGLRRSQDFSVTAMIDNVEALYRDAIDERLSP
jgi:glycosyltransferase involved in cell wall biosynthesis